jgi:DNA polymerase-3 subunit epsilon
MILVFYTETTGLPLFRERSNDSAQPHVVQLALLLFNEDGTEAESECLLVTPDGWEIPAETTAIHGIDMDRAMTEGVPESCAVDRFLLMQARSAVRVAHLESFDRRIMRIAITRAGIERDVIEATEARASFCTCNASTPVLGLPPTEKMIAKGMMQPKSASLAECMQHFFGEELVGAHDALVDARACARIYFYLKSLNPTQAPTGAPLVINKGDVAP